MRALKRSWRLPPAMLVLWIASTVPFAAAAGPASAKPPDAQKKPESLPGLVFAPRRLPPIGRWQIAHKEPQGRIYAVAWSPDSKSLAYGDDCYLRICDAQSFETLRIIAGHSGRIKSIDWNAASNRIVSGSTDGTVRVWSATGVPQLALSGHEGDVNAVAWTRDGGRFASAGNDGTVRVWNADGSAGPVIQGGGGSVSSVAWSPDGKRLVAGDDDYRVRVWNADGTAGPVCEGHLSRVNVVAWNPDGKHFASSTIGFRPADKPFGRQFFADVRIWNADGSQARTIPNDYVIFSMCWSPDGRRLASLVRPRQIQLNDLEGNATATLPFSTSGFAEPSLAWSPDGESLVGTGHGALTIVRVSDGTLRIGPHEIRQPRQQFDVTTAAIPSPNGEKWLFRPSAEAPYRVYRSDGSEGPLMPVDINRSSRFAWNPQQNAVAFASGGTQLCVWPIDSKSAKVVADLSKPVSTLSWSRAGDSLLVLDQTAGVHLIRTDGKRLFDHACTDIGQVDQVLFSAKGEKVAAVGRAGIDVLQTDGTLLKTISYGSPLSNSWKWFWWSDDTSRMAGYCQFPRKRSLLTTWDLAKGTSRSVSEFPEQIDSADCHPDGKRLLVGFTTGEWEIQRLDAPESTPLGATGHLNGTVLASAFSPEGERFATGGWDGMIRIWSADGTRRQVLSGNAWPVHELQWTTDGKGLISISRERAMRLWDVKTGRPELSVLPLSPTEYVLLTPDGRLIGAKREQIDASFVYLQEQPDGSTRISSQSQMRSAQFPTDGK